MHRVGDDERVEHRDEVADRVHRAADDAHVVAADLDCRAPRRAQREHRQAGADGNQHGRGTGDEARPAAISESPTTK